MDQGKKIQPSAVNSAHHPELLTWYNEAVSLQESLEFTEASKLYKKCVSMEHSLSCHNLAVLFERGLGVQKDLIEAMRLYELAGNLPESLFALGVLQRDVSGDVDEAHRLFENAAALGHADSCFNLAVLMEEDGDATGAEAQYRKASNMGHVKAAVNLGVMLSKLGKAEGETWMNLASKSGDSLAVFNMGVAKKDEGDDIQAVKYFEVAAKAGHVKASYNLAKHKINGEGTDVDLEGAMVLLDYAADEGDDRAARDVRKLFKIQRNERIIKRQEEEAAETDRTRLKEAQDALSNIDVSEGNDDNSENSWGGDQPRNRGKPSDLAIARVKAAVERRKKEKKAKAAAAVEA